MCQPKERGSKQCNARLTVRRDCIALPILGCASSLRAFSPCHYWLSAIGYQSPVPGSFVVRSWQSAFAKIPENEKSTVANEPPATVSRYRPVRYSPRGPAGRIAAGGKKPPQIPGYTTTLQI